ncbi:amidase [Imbroritus primus]|uniref:Amidase n=1 Tax=Imbroritus primus TaxID=3058603 RepID=A0ACD3SRE3_9BURK|nr:amidase [Burkholderiaceae bacterium PBA]
MLPTIDTILARIAAGDLTHTELLERCITASNAPEATSVYLHTWFDSALATARAADAARAAGEPLGPLAGLPVSIKDLYDVAGETTRSASVARDDAAAATSDAEAVRRLRAAGAALMGRTNMTEFAFSGVGINPHYGTPRNPTDRSVERIPGGSSSGAAVSVALGLCVAALGSDTGGSIRIPAALNGLTGFKSTQRRVPLDGALPLSRTLDTACAMARSVTDCLRLDSVLADQPLRPAAVPASTLRFAVPQTLLLDELEPEVGEAFERALRLLREAGASIEEIPLQELGELAALNAAGGFSAPESWAVHRKLLSTRRAMVDHRVVARIERGAAMSAADYLDLIDARTDWIERVEARIEPFDAILCPTVPLLAPPIAALAHDDAFFRANALLLRNTAVFNFLDGCSISLPCQPPGALPVGLMLSHAGMLDEVLLSAAMTVETLLHSAGLGLPPDGLM